MKLLRICLGLGDAIAFSGAAVWLAKQHGGLIFPCMAKYEVSVRSFFVNHPEIKVRVLDDSLRKKWQSADAINCIEETIPKDIDCDMYRWLYRKIGIPYEERWNSCPIPEACKQVSQLDIRGNWIFVHDAFHDDPPRDHMIDHKYLRACKHGEYWHRPDPRYGGSVLKYAYWIMYADEVHVIDSAFFHLTEQLWTKKPFLHRYAKPKPFNPIWNEYQTRHSWEILA